MEKEPETVGPEKDHNVAVVEPCGEVFCSFSKRMRSFCDLLKTRPLMLLCRASRK